MRRGRRGTKEPRLSLRNSAFSVRSLPSLQSFFSVSVEFGLIIEGEEKEKNRVEFSPGTNFGQKKQHKTVTSQRANFVKNEGSVDF